MDLLDSLMELDIYYLALKDMMLFTTELNILKVKKVVSHIFFSHYYAKTKVGVDSYDPLSIDKILTLRDVIILIKSHFLRWLAWLI